MEVCDDTYEVQIVVFDGKKWNYYEPKDTICEHHCTCIHLFTRKDAENVKNLEDIIPWIMMK